MRKLAGAILSYVYSEVVGRLPCLWLRMFYLGIYLRGTGTGTTVQLNCRFLNGRKVCFGDRNVINFGCLFDGRRYSITTGSDVSIGPNASILTLGHDPQSPDFEDRGGAVVVGDRVWIGYGAIVLPGVTLNDGCVVGAGAVVTQDVPAYTIVAGSPARQIGERTRDLKYRLSYIPLLT